MVFAAAMIYVGGQGEPVGHTMQERRSAFLRQVQSCVNAYVAVHYRYPIIDEVLRCDCVDIRDMQTLNVRAQDLILDENGRVSFGYDNEPKQR